MFGSLMMFASGVLASSPSSAERVRDPLLIAQPVGELGEDAPGERDVAQLDVHARLRGERLDDRQQRVRRQRGGLVGVGVDELHRLLFAFVFAGPAKGRRYSDAWPSPRPPATSCKAKDLADARYASRSTSTTWPRPPASPARTSRASSGARSANRRTCTCSPAASSAPPRCCAPPTTRSRRSACRSGSRASAPSRRASSACSASRRPSTGPTFPPAGAWAVVPSCVVRDYGRPQHRTFREDSTTPAAAGLACWP